ncbi:hypothetical protein TL16_g03316 [Triparma laevis f. inornata]|uniref:Uncharacterized protein n=1 Tax=Triparma laevis f. inornata TaxID=1714386 RepID=A0A9W7A1C2_9STRA|nr:hypothetical protein TL16_g03316 [Triparma laevis f. inornata]
MTSLLVSIVMQLFVGIAQNKKKVIWKILKEVLIVLCGMKAPWDAYRVASGAEKEIGTTLTPMMEMMWNETVELFAEPIPAILIQSSAILETLQAGKEVTMMEYDSLC